MRKQSAAGRGVLELRARRRCQDLAPQGSAIVRDSGSSGRGLPLALDLQLERARPGRVARHLQIA
jgi:hypothetical protein